MSQTLMTPAEREAFLADLHVGVLSIPRNDAAPLSAPIWYAYEPGGEIVVLTGPDSRKGRLLTEGVQVSLVVQREEVPYAYVTVEGPVTTVDEPDEADLLAMAVRYLGEEMGAGYVQATRGHSNVRVRIRPQRWLTVDYAKSSPMD